MVFAEEKEERNEKKAPVDSCMVGSETKRACVTGW